MFGYSQQQDTGLLLPSYELEETNQLNDKCAYLSVFDSLRARNLAKLDGLVSPGSTAVMRAGRLGTGYGVLTDTTSGGILHSNSDTLLDSTNTNNTFIVIREKTDATIRASMLFGYIATADSRVSAHGPWSDNTIYFDFGNAFTGRLAISGQTWAAGLDYFIFIAGATKGREVWRNGVKIGSNTAKTDTRPGSSDGFYIGANHPTISSDSETFYMFGAFLREWTDAECHSWFSDASQLIRKDSLAFNFPAASGVTGTLARTNNNDTLVSSGTTTVKGTLARTNNNDTLSSAGTTTIIGLLSRTNNNDTLVASGSAGSTVTGTLARTNANDTLAASGFAGIVTGTLAKTNNNDTLSAFGSGGVIAPLQLPRLPIEPYLPINNDIGQLKLRVYDLYRQIAIFTNKIAEEVDKLNGF